MPTTYKKKVISVKRSSSAPKGKANIRTTKTGRKFKVFKESPKRTISVSVVSPTHNAFKQKALSPKSRTTASGRKFLIWTESRAPSGRVYAIQTVLPGSRPPMTK